MKKYDVIVIGSGCGLIVTEAAAMAGNKTALVEMDKMGGTCLNVGCIPSKMLIYPADVIYEIENSSRLGINASLSNVDFAGILERTSRTIEGYRNKLHRQLHRMHGVDLYESRARFIDEHTLDVDGQRITAPLIFIACGTRPVLPQAELSGKPGIITNDNLLNLTSLPAEILIVGGGYVACEYGHFFAAMGSKVTMLEMTGQLLSGEEPEVSQLVEKTLRSKINVQTNTILKTVNEAHSGWNISTENTQDNSSKSFFSSHVLFAMGRIPNTDILGSREIGIDHDDKGYIRVNDYLQTNIEGIYAIGDVNGQYMFRHAANYEAELAWHNGLHSRAGFAHLTAVDYLAMPHAVFTRPQVASVGMTEARARKEHDIGTGIVSYFETAKGEAMQEKEGFAKAVVDKSNGNVLGFHIAGPNAAILIQEVVNAMSGKGGTDTVKRGIHIHPSISELVPLTISSAK
ncbi:MAG: dihydrolipoyl dehydrogenase [Dehalococcoidaceae bacterium]|nr:dihydrolipoyl dehydrogenase [Dehalococcoidaceae bacterium]